MKKILNVVFVGLILSVLVCLFYGVYLLTRNPYEKLYQKISNNSSYACNIARECKREEKVKIYGKECTLITKLDTNDSYMTISIENEQMSFSFTISEKRKNPEIWYKENGIIYSGDYDKESNELIYYVPASYAMPFQPTFEEFEMKEIVTAKIMMYIKYVIDLDL